MAVWHREKPGLFVMPRLENLNGYKDYEKT